MRRDTLDWEKVFAKYKSNKGLLPKIYKELFKVSKNTRTPLKMGQHSTDTLLNKTHDGNEAYENSPHIYHPDITLLTI